VTLAHAPDVWQSGAWGTYAAGANSLNLGPEPPLSAEWQAGKATMYSRRRFRFRPLPVESWPLILIVSAWSIAVVILHEIVEFTWIVMPVLPVTLIGIAVSLYLGFKSVSAYNRWWEARTAIGSMQAVSPIIEHLALSAAGAGHCCAAWAIRWANAVFGPAEGRLVCLRVTPHDARAHARTSDETETRSSLPVAPELCRGATQVGEPQFLSLMTARGEQHWPQVRAIMAAA